MTRGDVDLLTSSPQGDALAWMERCEAPGSSAEARCDVVVLADGKLRRIGRLALLRDGLAWSPDGNLGVLVDVDLATREGELRIWSRAVDVEFVAEAVTSFDVGLARVGYISRGVGYVRWTDASTIEARVPTHLRSIKLSPTPAVERVVALALGDRGELLTVEAGGRARLLARDIVEYGFSPSGRFAIALTGAKGRELRAIPLEAGGRTRVLGRGVVSRVQAARSDAVAFVADSGGGRALYVADVEAGSVQMVARDAARFAWAAQAPVLAWVAGPLRVLGAVRLGTSPVVVSEGVAAFDLSPDGSTLAFTRSASAPAQNELIVATRLDKQGGGPVAYDVSRFALMPDASGVVFESLCHEGFCTLSGPEAAGPNVSGIATHTRNPAAYTKLAGLTKWFKVDEHTGRVLAVGQFNELNAMWKWRNYYIDVDVDLDNVIFLPPDSSRVAYVNRTRGRAGVYVADLGADEIAPVAGKGQGSEKSPSTDFPFIVVVLAIITAASIYLYFRKCPRCGGPLVEGDFFMSWTYLKLFPPHRLCERCRASLGRQGPSDHDDVSPSGP